LNIQITILVVKLNNIFLVKIGRECLYSYRKMKNLSKLIVFLLFLTIIRSSCSLSHLYLLIHAFILVHLPDSLSPLLLLILSLIRE